MRLLIQGFLFLVVMQLQAYGQAPALPGPNPGGETNLAERKRIMDLFQALQTRRTHDTAWFKENFTDAKLHPEIRQNLISPLQHYYQSTGWQPEVFNLLEAWQKELNPGQPLILPPPRVKATPAASTALSLKNATLMLKKFRPLRLPVLPNTELGDLKLINGFYRDNRLWLEARCYKEPVPSPFHENCGILYSLDLVKGEEDVIFFEPHRPNVPLVEVMNGLVFVKTRDQVKIYDLKKKSQQDLTVSMDEDARLVAVSGQMFLVSTNSIATLDLKTGASALLASTRRRPPQSPLDEIASLHPALLLPGASGNLLLQAGSDLYTCGQNRTWIKTATLGPNLRPLHSQVVSQSDGRLTAVFGFMDSKYSQYGYVDKLFALTPGIAEPQLLVAKQEATGMPYMPAPSPGPKPQWTLPSPLLPPETSYAWVGQDLWTTTSANATKAKGKIRLALCCFQAGSKAVFRVQTQTDETTVNLADAQANPHIFSMKFQLVPIPDGLAAIGLEGNGYWSITTEELKQSLQSVP